MTCATCGAVGSAGATWCPACYLPYVRAGAAPQPYSLPPTVAAPRYAPPTGAGAHAFAPPAYAPPAYAPPMYAPPTYAPPMYAPPTYAPGVGSQRPYDQPVWPAKLGLVVPEFAVQTGDLPRICVVTGMPTDNMVRMRWMWAPAWSVFLGLLIRYLIADKTAGYLPIHPSVRRKRLLLAGSSVLGFFLGLGLIAGGSSTSSPVLPLIGILVWVGSIVAVVRVQQLTPRVRRAAPGYLALPKASPEFAAAFKGGRPAGQVPYTSTPATFQTRKVFVVLGVICVAIALTGAVVGAVAQGHDCSSATVHPNVSTVDADFAYSQTIVAQINAADGGQGLTQDSARQLLAEHARLLAQVQAVTLSPADRAALDSYAQSLQSYDGALTAAMQQQDAAGDAALRQADDKLTAAGLALTSALHTASAACE